jgi:hypothetical protein
MGRKRVCDPEDVLEAFARGLPLLEISRALGDVPVGTLGAIVHRARREGDPRAALRCRPAAHRAATSSPAAKPESGQFRRRRLARAFPGSPAELADAATRTSAPVKRLTPGVATAGWRPSWLRV